MLLKNSKVLLKSKLSNYFLLTKTSIKYFSSHPVVHNENHEHENSHEEHHDDHGHHGHHEITGEVDLNKVYVPLNSNLSPFISLTGVPSNMRQVNTIIEGEAKAKGAITPISIPFITKNRVFHNDLANVSYEDNPYFHPEPYGYLITDDVFNF